MKKQKRIGNLEFRKATYLLPKKDWPKNPAYNIDYWYPNPYYGKEDEYELDPLGYYTPKDNPARISPNCFKNEQSCFAIASFEYDEHEGIYELRFIENRPLCLNEEERKAFWELIEYGYKALKPKID